MTDPLPQDLVPRPELALLSCAEMAAADAATIAGGTPGSVLMEAAGRAVVAALIERFDRQSVVVLCGPGNNGGDGFVAARRLQAMGWPVRLALLGSRQALKGDAAWAASLWSGPIEALSVNALDPRPLIVDALFGAGLARPVEGAAASVIERINALALPVAAVDVPSGLHGDTGEILGIAPAAAITVTFFRAKTGHYSANGLQLCGDLRVADIGIPATVLAKIGPRQWRNDPALWSRLLRREHLDDNKYRRGHLTILGGSQATGAARLAALAARRAGAGLATIAAPRSALAVYQAGEPGNLVAECEGVDSFSHLLEDKRRNAVLIGPGSGLNERTKRATLDALSIRRAAVLDADAVTVFAANPSALFEAIGGPTLLTPHEGEFARLFPDLARGPGKLARVRQAAARSGATILLKGPDTVIAAPDGRAVINVHAPRALATAGSGDVLAGIAAGLMSQGLSPLAAAAAAAWLHGESAYRFGRPGLIAEDLVGGLPDALVAALAADAMN